MKKKATRYLSSFPPTSLLGKHIFITGGNSGIGLGLAQHVLSLGGIPHLCCRNQEKAEEAKRVLLSSFPNGQVHLHSLDLSRFASIDSFLEELASSSFSIHGFVHNAGTFRQEKRKTEDGYDLTLMTNLIGTIRLNEGLVPLFARQKQPPVVVFTSSLSATWSKITFSSIQNPYPKSKVGLYAESKRGIYLYARHCQKTESLPYVPVLTHPGITFTPLFFKGYPKAFAAFLSPIFRFLFHSPVEAALIDLEALLRPSKTVYFSPSGLFSCSGLPKGKKFPRKLERSRNNPIPELIKNLQK